MAEYAPRNAWEALSQGVMRVGQSIGDTRRRREDEERMKREEERLAAADARGLEDRERNQLFEQIALANEGWMPNGAPTTMTEVPGTGAPRRGLSPTSLAGPNKDARAGQFAGADSLLPPPERMGRENPLSLPRIDPAYQEIEGAGMRLHRLDPEVKAQRERTAEEDRLRAQAAARREELTGALGGIAGIRDPAAAAAGLELGVPNDWIMPPPPTERAPVQWTRGVDEATGRVYQIHPHSGEVRWIDGVTGQTRAPEEVTDDGVPPALTMPQALQLVRESVAGGGMTPDEQTREAQRLVLASRPRPSQPEPAGWMSLQDAAGRLGGAAPAGSSAPSRSTAPAPQPNRTPTLPPPERPASRPEDILNRGGSGGAALPTAQVGGGPADEETLAEAKSYYDQLPEEERAAAMAEDGWTEEEIRAMTGGF